MIITKLPPGDWRLIVIGDEFIAACPEHPPRIINKLGEVFELAPYWEADAASKAKLHDYGAIFE